MSSPRRLTTPRLSVFAILRAVLAAYRQHRFVLVVIALVVFGTINALESVTPEVELSHLDARGAILGIGLGGLAAGYHAFGEAFFEGVVAAHAVVWRTGGPPPRLGSLVGSIAYLTLIGVNAVMAVGTVVGLFALVVPGIVFSTYLAVAPALVEVEGLGVRASLRRSVELVRGFFWPMLLLAWGAYLTSLAAGQALEVALESFLVEFLAVTIVEALIAPFYGLATVLAAFALIERKGEARPTSPPAPRTGRAGRDG